LKHIFHKDEWLSGQIGKSVYQLKANNMLEESFLEDWEEFRREHIKENYFVFSKINTNSVNIFQCLEKANFKLVDTNLQFELNDNKLSEKQQNNDIEICFAEKKHQQALGKIAKDNFHYSRFHLDSLINNDIANKIKQNWVKNYFFGKRGDEMVVALLQNKPVGFLQLIIKEKELTIDLICVDRIAQGRGVASSMIHFARRDIKQSFIKAGTQIGNLPAINLYQKLGFVLTQSDYLFHYHS
jgi:ribosomal protein S18 acetylase RimI-like enzyme